MRILVDIGHPAHVHYFRNAIRLLEQRGHRFLITARDKEVTLSLLKQYGFEFVCTGKNKSGSLSKFLTMIRNDRVILRHALRFKPDIFLSFFSPFAAQVSWLLRKPSIGFTDSEFAKMSIRLTRPFTTHIFTPECFWDDFGRNHQRFNGFMESFYLQPPYFQPDVSVLRKLGVSAGEPFFLLRFVSFNAGHDIGESGISEKWRAAIVEYLASKGKLFISSEAPLPDRFKRYQLPTSASDFHSVLAFAHMYVGEGITTASECAQLGTPAVLINTLRTAYIEEQARLGLIFRYARAEEAIDKIKQLASRPDLKTDFLRIRDHMLLEHIDCTRFLVQLIDEYPRSVHPESSPPITTPVAHNNH